MLWQLLLLHLLLRIGHGTLRLGRLLDHLRCPRRTGRRWRLHLLAEEKADDDQLADGQPAAAHGSATAVWRRLTAVDDAAVHRRLAADNDADASVSDATQWVDAVLGSSAVSQPVAGRLLPAHDAATPAHDAATPACSSEYRPSS